MRLRHGDLLHDRARLDVDHVHHAVGVRRREQPAALGVIGRVERLLAERGLPDDAALLPVDPEERWAEMVGEDHDVLVGNEEGAVLVRLLRVEGIAAREADLLFHDLVHRVVDHHAVGRPVEEA